MFGVANMLAVLRMTRDMLDGAKKHWPEDRELKARSFYRWQDAIDSVSVVIADIEAMYPPNAKDQATLIGHAANTENPDSK